ncbi:DUF429 domain-containing protein [Mesorhizobium opportunistum]|uniref:DUF429 domain-containing protein n=1 Tax=Mesorhizobium opportunistum TaxID=593909 RepID=UPI003339F612
MRSGCGPRERQQHQGDDEAKEVRWHGRLGLAGCPVDLVAVDMPLSRTPIVSRRASDDAVSRAYGGRWAGTHTPSAVRPGAVSDTLRAAVENIGYKLRTSGLVSHGLIEVYPHPALIEFASAERRLPYKFGNRRSYWPDQPSTVRSLNIFREMKGIASLMENEISGVEAAMPELDYAKASGREWKAYEDMLDAVVCAAVGICVLEGRAVPFGDDQSAIWIPKPGSARSRVERATPEHPLPAHDYPDNRNCSANSVEDHEGHC